MWTSKSAAQTWATPTAEKRTYVDDKAEVGHAERALFPGVGVGRPLFLLKPQHTPIGTANTCFLEKG